MSPDTGSHAGTSERKPPRDEFAERAVLGAMLLNADAIAPAIEVLRDKPEEVFYVGAHQHIYGAILELLRHNHPVDLVTLHAQLERAGTLQPAGGPAYLAELSGAVPTSANVEYYAKLVLETSILRRLISTCSRIAGEAFENFGSVDELLDKAESDIFSIAEKRQTNPIYRVRDLIEAGIHRIEEQMRSRTGITGLGSGFHDLDALLSGFQDSDMIVLAARPSVGKTAFALNVAAYAATKLDKGVLVFSLEMAKEQLVQRLLCMVGGVNTKKLREGFLASHEFAKVQRAAADLDRAHLYIDDTPNIGVLELRSKARRHAANHPVDLLIIDYLQLVSGVRRAESRQTEIAEISRSIKGIARELRKPVIALSQLSREAEKDESGMPKLSHLRESGAIEQDADVVMMLARAPAEDGETHSNVIRVNVAKQRNGPTGSLELIFDRDVQRFRDMARGPGGTPAMAVANEAPPPSFDDDDTPF